MTKLNHRLKKHDIGIIDSQSGKVLKTQKAVDVSDELSLDADSEPLQLLYTTAERGEIVQLRQGGTSVHYFTGWIHLERDRESALSHWAAWTNSSKERLIELCIKYSPTSYGKIMDEQPTPETSRFVREILGFIETRNSLRKMEDFARKLERERDEARKQLESVRGELAASSQDLSAVLGALPHGAHDAAEGVDIIRAMREAINAAHRVSGNDHLQPFLT